MGLVFIGVVLGLFAVGEFIAQSAATTPVDAADKILDEAIDDYRKSLPDRVDAHLETFRVWCSLRGLRPEVNTYINSYLVSRDREDVKDRINLAINDAREAADGDLTQEEIDQIGDGVEGNLRGEFRDEFIRLMHSPSDAASLHMQAAVRLFHQNEEKKKRRKR